MLIEVSQIPPDGLDIVLPEEVLDLGLEGVLGHGSLWLGVPRLMQTVCHL